MSGYIDKYKLVLDLQTDKWIAENSLKYVLQDISEQPEADVVEVVRCKDCRYYQDNNEGYPHPDCKWGNGETLDENDFCSAGERK